MRTYTLVAFTLFLMTEFLGGGGEVSTSRPMCFFRGPNKGKRCDKGDSQCRPCRGRGRKGGRKTEIKFSCTVDEHTKGKSRAGVGDKFQKWADNLVPYQFDSSYTDSDKQTFVKATQQIEAVTCIRFKEMWASQYLLVSRTGSCGASYISSYVDKLGANSPTRMVTEGACMDPSNQLFIGHLAHELMHALGFHHTQKRPDRDDFITVMPSFLNNYQYSKCYGCKDMGVSYDCMSIMHYRQNSDGSNMKALNSDACDLTSSNRILRTSDIEMMNRLYECSAKKTCQGSCGGRSPGGCMCDNGCVQRGDCCPDKEDFCPVLTCNGSCGKKVSDGKTSCYCDSFCTYYNDCCKDRENYC